MRSRHLKPGLNLRKWCRVHTSTRDEFQTQNCSRACRCFLVSHSRQAQATRNTQRSTATREVMATGIKPIHLLIPNRQTFQIIWTFSVQRPLSCTWVSWCIPRAGSSWDATHVWHCPASRASSFRPACTMLHFTAQLRPRRSPLYEGLITTAQRWV